MGCAESRQEFVAQPLPSDFDAPDNSMPLASGMGQPQASVQLGFASLSTQHERLILELLPFKEARQFHE